ncbi:MAG: glycosyltransferase [Bacteroidetes bacterium]|nr:glycosyltransferase [Bacteroidota bacterium]
MKIGYLSTFYPYRGGIAQFNASLYRELEKQHELRAFTFTRQYPDLLFPGQTQMVTGADTADPVPATRVLDSVNPVSWLKTAGQISAWSPDLLIMKFWMPFFSPSLGTVSGKVRKKGTRSIAILDNVIPHEKRPGDLALIRYYLNRVDGFIAMSKAVEQDLLSLKPDAHYRLKAHPVYDHFPVKIDPLQARKALNLPENKTILLFFGFIREYKGLDLLIEALFELDDRFHLVIAGEVYGNFDRYQSQIDRLGLQNRISVFTRYISDQEVPVFFSAADLGVLPYKTATQSGIVQIASQFDLPVLVTDVGGLTEMVSHGETGWVVSRPDAEEVAAGIHAIFASQGTLSAWREEIKRRKPELSWPGFAREVLSLYQELGSSTTRK